MKTMFFGSPLEASRCRRLEPECLDDLERFEPEFELELEPELEPDWPDCGGGGGGSAAVKFSGFSDSSSSLMFSCFRTLLMISMASSSSFLVA